MTQPDDDGDDFSELAARQYDDIMNGDDVELADAVWDACELILNYPSQAVSRSGTITTRGGLRRELPVRHTTAHRFFWDPVTGRVEAIFPYP